MRVIYNYCFMDHWIKPPSSDPGFGGVYASADFTLVSELPFCPAVGLDIFLPGFACDVSVKRIWWDECDKTLDIFFDNDSVESLPEHEKEVFYSALIKVGWKKER